MNYAIKPRARFNPLLRDAACGALVLTVGILALAVMVSLIAPFMSSTADGLAGLGRLG